MLRLKSGLLSLIPALGIWLASATSPALATDTLSWHTNANRVTADISSTDLITVLEKIAGSTGWRVFVEPDTIHRVSTKFKNLPPGPALRMLLGDVNFALVPATNHNGRSSLYVFRTSAGNATRLISPEMMAAVKKAAPKIIGNELIVRLRPGAKIDDIARLLGAKVVGKIDGLNAYRLRFDDISTAEAAKDQLASNPDVTSVENNILIDKPDMPAQASGPAGSPPMLQMKDPPASGRVIVGLVDTGVQSLGQSLDQFILKSVSDVSPGELDPNSPSHGTAMAETMLRAIEDMTKGRTSVQIQPVDVFGANENTTTFDVANGIILAYNNGSKIINLSLGSTADSQVLHDLIDQLAAKNILIVGAKGNQPVSAPFFPAAYSDVLAVTALDPNGQLAPYANRADIPTVGAPGTSLVYFNGRSWMVQGTSPAAANVSGVAAGYMDVNQVGTGAAKTYIQNGMSLH